MSVGNVWKPLPLYLIVLEELKRLTRYKRTNIVRDDELYESVRKIAKIRGIEVSFSDFLKALLVLEVHGYIHVETVSDKHRMIELLKE